MGQFWSGSHVGSVWAGTSHRAGALGQVGLACRVGSGWHVGLVQVGLARWVGLGQAAMSGRFGLDWRIRSGQRLGSGWPACEVSLGWRVGSGRVRLPRRVSSGWHVGWFRSGRRIRSVRAGALGRAGTLGQAGPAHQFWLDWHVGSVQTGPVHRVGVLVQFRLACRVGSGLADASGRAGPARRFGSYWRVRLVRASASACFTPG